MNLTPVDFKAVAAKGCFVYAYLREHDRTPYYIGFASTAQRPTCKYHTCQLPAYDALIVVLRSGLSEQEAFNWEKYYILRFGRRDKNNGLLVNLTDGGQGATGRANPSLVAENKSRIKYGEAELGLPEAIINGFDIEERERIVQAFRKGVRGADLLRYRAGLEKNIDEKYGMTVEEFSALTDNQKLKIRRQARAGQPISLKYSNRELATAGKYGITPEQYVGLTSIEKDRIKGRFRRGNRGAELIAGLVAA